MINIRNLDMFNSEKFEEFFDISMEKYKKKSSIENIRFNSDDDFERFKSMFDKLKKKDIKKWSKKDVKELNEIQGISTGLRPIKRKILLHGKRI